MPCSQAPRPWLIGTNGKVSGCSRICVHGCHSTARSRARQTAASASIVGSVIVMSRHDPVPSSCCPFPPRFPCHRLHLDRGTGGGGDPRYPRRGGGAAVDGPPRRGTRGARAGRYHRSEEHTSELQSLMRISYAVFCLKKKTHQQLHHSPTHFIN